MTIQNKRSSGDSFHLNQQFARFHSAIASSTESTMPLYHTSLQLGINTNQLINYNENGEKIVSGYTRTRESYTLRAHQEITALIVMPKIRSII